MKTMFAGVVCFSLIALVGAAAGGDKTAAKLEGTWLATGGSNDGKTIPAKELDKIMLTIVIKDGKYSINVQGKEVEAGSYKADPAKKPPTLDISVESGKDKGDKQLGIYKLDDDNLIVAVANPGKDRPKNLEGGPDVNVTILKRKK
jgi:uncharacterized protein (TIGR03067 family)